MVSSVAWGKLIHVENLKLKISWHCPFKEGEKWKPKPEVLHVPEVSSKIFLIFKYVLEYFCIYKSLYYVNCSISLVEEFEISMSNESMQYPLSVKQV
jgi:hypothetical protein